MARTVWKQTVDCSDMRNIMTFSWPEGAEVLHIGVQQFQNQMSIWYRCDPNLKHEERKFHFVGTGDLCPERASHVGTAIMLDGSLVIHVFEQHMGSGSAR